jgi:UDP-glucose 4-epimerase
MSYQKCLVLGANGFVGSYLVEALANKSELSVIAFDRFSTPPQFEELSNIKVLKGDIFEDSQLREALQGVDTVMHSFSATTPFVSDQDPYKDITDNLQRSVRLFELCAQAGVKKIGFISSAGTVYGSVTEVKTASEDDAPLPVSPYGINKLSIEHYLEYFKKRNGLDYTVFRLTNPYGPRQLTKNNQGVVPAFINKIKNNEELTIYGDGTSSRDYIYMRDAARMIVRGFLSERNDHSIYNIGSGVQTTLGDIVESLSRIAKKRPQIAYKEAPKTFLLHSSVSIERFIQEFGEPHLTSLDDGLRETFITS